MNLKDIRQQTGKTQEIVAKDLGMKKQTYQNYELEKREPGIDTLIKIADYFRVSVDDIIGHGTQINTTFKKLINLCNELNDIEIQKLIHYAEGLIINRQFESKHKSLKILKED